MVYLSKSTWCSDLAISTSNFGSTRSIAWKLIPPKYNVPEQPGTARITTMASRRMRGTGGRILPDERDVDNSVPISMDAESTDHYFPRSTKPTTTIIPMQHPLKFHPRWRISS
jgi:hypothetical protein